MDYFFNLNNEPLDDYLNLIESTPKVPILNLGVRLQLYDQHNGIITVMPYNWFIWITNKQVYVENLSAKPSNLICGSHRQSWLRLNSTDGAFSFRCLVPRLLIESLYSDYPITNRYSLEEIIEWKLTIPITDLIIPDRFKNQLHVCDILNYAIHRGDIEIFETDITFERMSLVDNKSLYKVPSINDTAHYRKIRTARKIKHKH